MDLVNMDLSPSRGMLACWARPCLAGPRADRGCSKGARLINGEGGTPSRNAAFIVGWRRFITAVGRTAARDFSARTLRIVVGRPLCRLCSNFSLPAWDTARASIPGRNNTKTKKQTTRRPPRYPRMIDFSYYGVAVYPSQPCQTPPSRSLASHLPPRRGCAPFFGRSVSHRRPRLRHARMPGPLRPPCATFAYGSRPSLIPPHFFHLSSSARNVDMIKNWSTIQRQNRGEAQQGQPLSRDSR